MNDKFQKYKDVLSPQQDKIRLKRRINETNENISGLLSPRWTESGRNKTLHPTINRGPEEDKILNKNNLTRSRSIGGMFLCFCFTMYYWLIIDSLENKTNPTHNESYLGGERLVAGLVESFSFYMSKDRWILNITIIIIITIIITIRRLDKGPKTEVGLFSQASHGQGGNIDTATGRFYSDSGGLFMVTGTFHVKTEVLVVPGEWVGTHGHHPSKRDCAFTIYQ